MTTIGVVSNPASWKFNQNRKNQPPCESLRDKHCKVPRGNTRNKQNSVQQVQGDPDHPAAIFSSGTVNPIKLGDYIGVKLLLENIFELFSGPELGFFGGQNLILTIEIGDVYFYFR